MGSTAARFAPRVAVLALAVGGWIGVTANAQSSELRQRIGEALEQARPALLAHLAAARGSDMRCGALALLVLAALHDGVPASEPTLARAIARLRHAEPNQTYDVALRLTVLAACPTFPDRDVLARKDTDRLLEHCGDHGGFQYYRKPSTWDLSNTQYAALGLRAAVALGQDVPRAVWQRMADTIGANQGDHGGFQYSRVHTTCRADASMTIAGIAVLAICRQQLDGGPALRARIGKQIERAWDWLAAHDEAIGSRSVRWSYYLHYGLERAAILTDVEKIGGRIDWYARGAEMFVDAQLGGGGWRSSVDGLPGQHLSRERGDLVPTAFAVLFLRRRFQKQAGPITPRVLHIVNVGPASSDGDIAACAKQLAARGIAAMPEVVQGLHSDVVQRRRAAAQALDGICGQRFGFDPERARAANRRAVRAVELWFLQRRGK